ncbi:putative lyase [Helianthus annuus]|nr:putative lyase [Helianthus annuus]KAJ0778073.1 putative lyase [Helianthus annuus]
MWGEKYMARSQTLKEVVRTMICRGKEMVENPLSILNLIDDLQRLGISYHFIKEISKVLDNIYCTTTKVMKSEYEDRRCKNIVSVISRALDFPLHWMLPRAETKWFIEVYVRRRDMNPIVLELAKLDFNMVQAVYQDDLKYASRYEFSNNMKS